MNNIIQLERGKMAIVPNGWFLVKDESPVLAGDKVLDVITSTWRYTTMYEWDFPTWKFAAIIRLKA